MQMPGRKFTQGNSGYRYGFNGKENDNEVKGEGNQQDYGMWIYDGRLGRFLSVDPLQVKFAWYSPYQFTGNSPIAFVDLDGLERNYFIYEFSASSGRPVFTKKVTQTHEEGILNGVYNAFYYAGNKHIPYERRGQYNGDLITDCSDVYVLHDGFLNLEFSNSDQIQKYTYPEIRKLSSVATEDAVSMLYYAEESVKDLRASSNDGIVDSPDENIAPSKKQKQAGNNTNPSGNNTNPPTSKNRGRGTLLEKQNKSVAQQYENSAEGAASDVVSGKRIVPILKYDNPNPNGRNYIKFDSPSFGGLNFVDSKVNVTGFPKSINQINRAAEALQQNPGATLEYRVPPNKVNAMYKLIRDAGQALNTNITVKAAPIK